MNTSLRVVVAFVLSLLGSACVGHAQSAQVQSFTPEGTLKRIRQIQVRFSAPMVAFGDPRGAGDPFDIECGEKGVGRWADPENWIFDFERDLPSGTRCRFTLRKGLKTLQGDQVTGRQSFEFSTGGPSIKESTPFEGQESISDDQVFLLELDGEPVEASVLSHVWFSVEGIPERIGTKIVKDAAREAILDVRFPKRYYPKRPEHLLLIQAVRTFPPLSKVSLVWGAGVSSPSGAATKQDQVLAFRTWEDFRATLSCTRENPDKDCVPIAAMRLELSAATPWKTISRATLQGPGGRIWKPELEEDQMVTRIRFKPPFPEKATLQLHLPAGIKDEAGRTLANADRFPLDVRTDEYPPLAKFAADFGILELKGGAVLPVTVRNIESELSGKTLEVRGGEGKFDPLPMPAQGRIAGRTLRIPSDKVAQMLGWIQKISSRQWEDRSRSMFGPATTAEAKSFTLPKPNGARPFEVIGIPFKAPGFYVVELESEILGAALLGKAQPMFVPAAALVTNLSVHFKRGVESSLVWVTALDEGKPAPGAEIEVRNCEGTVLWHGVADARGVARVPELPAEQALPYCDEIRTGGLAVSARLGEDMAFVHTSWDDGIESWRFNLPTEWQPRFTAGHTITDRPLFRAGETVHMKHILRHESTAGFAFVAPGRTPPTAVIQHLGSDQKYDLALKWDAAGTAETSWTIPTGARLGTYHIYLATQPQKNDQRSRYRSGIDDRDLQFSGSFRVEEFRVPLMRATIRPPARNLVTPKSVPIDLTVSFLAGGGATRLPVKFRHLLRPRPIVEIDGYDGYVFSNGKVKEGVARWSESDGPEVTPIPRSVDLTLDASGSARTDIGGLPDIDAPMQLETELEYRDPIGELQTASSTIPLWPANRIIGIRPKSWAQSKGGMAFTVAVLDLARKPVANAPVTVDTFRKRTYSHRKRLVGGFYAYEHFTEVTRAGTICSGKTDLRGILICEAKTSLSGSVSLEAVGKDEAGRSVSVHRDVWVAGEDEWWFAAKDDDRIDLLPEKKRYEPGEKARFQVRMPFRKATALITVEREGVGDVYVMELSGKAPVIELPIKGNYAPNVFISALVVRGRSTEVAPAATVDLGRPAFKLGIAEINVGWKAHELAVKVTADKEQYRVREKAKVRIAVTTPDGAPPPKGSEAALVAVDEGLLELMPNESWRLLDAMMGRRAYNVATSTAQMHVIGKRHFGLKALPPGGGGGRQSTRELFDTLLLWKGRVPLDPRGMATVEIPLNDSVTSFRIVAIATGGVSRFGAGSTSIRSTQDLMILPGVAPLARSGDRIRAGFTLRNTTERLMTVHVRARIGGAETAPQTVALASGESQEVFWEVTTPAGVEALRYEVEASAGDGINDRVTVTQRIVPAVPVRTLQATLLQLSGEHANGADRIDVERPKGALPGMGGVEVTLKPALSDGLSGVERYMRMYPYTCLEQSVSRAIALHDLELWKRIQAELPGYIDQDGLLKYFPVMRQGSDVLTSYIVSAAHEAGMEIPEASKKRILAGLRDFVKGKIDRASALPTMDLSIRRLAAIEALSRSERIHDSILSTIAIQPTLWPTSAVIDWLGILQRTADLNDRGRRLREAEQILRTRLNLQGSAMSLSTEKNDRLWWLMVSPDSNAVRLLAGVLDLPGWRADVPRLVRGVLSRQRAGRWDTTVANAWGVLAVKKFSKLFEGVPVTGSSRIELAGATRTVDWTRTPKGAKTEFPWPTDKSTLTLATVGTGRPWATIQSLAAIPLTAPLSTGFNIKRTATPLEQKVKGSWTKGDLMRVRLEIEAQSDMTWVVVDDPAPAGASILGTGLGRDSRMGIRGEKREGWVWPAFEERSFEGFRAYYEFVPKGTWTVEYTVRLNNEGTLQLPPTRVEAMYSPEMFGEFPNQAIQVR